MASYFDLPPQQKAPAASIEGLPEGQRKQFGGMSYMSPAVTLILEGLGEDHSDSSSDEKEPSSEDDIINTHHAKKDPINQKAQQQKQKCSTQQAPRPSSLSPSRGALKRTTTKGSSHNKASERAAKNISAKPKPSQPQMARFHSLRSMLFQANIQDKMKSATQDDSRKERDSADRWKSQHEERQMHRPKTPETDAQNKSGIGSRIRMTMRRMTTKDAGMEKIREDGAPVEFNDRSLKASSDNEVEKPNMSEKHHDSDNESINHSDVEDLVRWISRRDAASDGEMRKKGVVEIKEDSGHESFGDSDVDDLVRYVSRRSDPKEEVENKTQHSGYSDASTESDEEQQQDSSDEEEDADELVRWISHHQGSKAGPVRRNLARPELDSDVEKHYDSDVLELGRWFHKHDATSGSSAATTPVKETFDEKEEEEERGRPRSRECGSPDKEKRHITEDDVDELVQWVTGKDMKQQPTLISTNEDEVDQRTQQLGMSNEDESLSHLDIQDLVQHARKTSGDQTSEAATLVGDQTGDLRTLRDEKAKKDVQDPLGALKEKKEELSLTMDEGSVSHDDVEDLVAHVRQVSK